MAKNRLLQHRRNKQGVGILADLVDESLRPKPEIVSTFKESAEPTKYKQADNNVFRENPILPNNHSRILEFLMEKAGPEYIKLENVSIKGIADYFSISYGGVRNVFTGLERRCYLTRRRQQYCTEITLNKENCERYRQGIAPKIPRKRLK